MIIKGYLLLFGHAPLGAYSGICRYPTTQNFCTVSQVIITWKIAVNMAFIVFSVLFQGMARCSVLDNDVMIRQTVEVGTNTVQ